MGIPFHFDTVQTLAFLPLEHVQMGKSLDDAAAPASQTHSCGDCHACCVLLPIASGIVSDKPKPAGVDCPHLGSQGCRIYQQRPDTCRKFDCAWLADSSWPMEWRPDQSGLLCLREDIEPGISAALVYEIKPDAISRPTTQRILTCLKETTAMVALVNLNQQRQLLRGRHWAEPAEHGIRRPHFLQSIRSLETESPSVLRDAS